MNDDVDEKNLLSCLNSINGKNIFVNLNNNNKRSSSSSQLENGNIKRRKADLTCVICEGHAYNYNFGQITCESCKNFFRRNASLLIENTKCRSSNNIRCNIRYDIKQKCQRCRLLKCLESGMRKDLILTPEKKLSKEKCLEENRRMKYSRINNMHEVNTEESSNINTYELSENDWLCICNIQDAYSSSSRSVPSASSMLSLELTFDKMSTYMNTLDIYHSTMIKIINFLKQISEFEQLNDNDRLILVKYNLCSLILVRDSLTFDTTRELCYEDDVDHDRYNSMSSNNKAFAERCKSLFMLCYSYELNQLFFNILHTLHSLVDNDPIIVQLLMLSMIFLKGSSCLERQEPILDDSKHVFYLHSKYTDLLFRYLIKQSSFNTAVMKMMHFVEVFMKYQRLSKDFHQEIKSKVDVDNINPFMKSFLHFA
ncbi:unnamed protein product [Adineta steineri]|uniref:Uncharacterized protein n=1 Tax=Adineta steineri TaxID=433720 RepID=A0A816FH94_9BILA|nr:unnamed protein product [Adineta steineri]CAF1661428.1 unnamed protein product [Adineta steineri]